ncbi:hypothetical protein ACE41H_15705 [Paenibacillus enshidis]|uniref:Uncharacterized protein n=1 Tax=Paenibacillus enshidis TaxID=1458439 RepID=A0ABV5AW31_9BACL
MMSMKQMPIWLKERSQEEIINSRREKRHERLTQLERRSAITQEKVEAALKLIRKL